MPLNWSAYEDIADFFTNDVKQNRRQAIYGHMDYGKKDPRWAGASPTPGCPWRAPATRATPTAAGGRVGIRVDSTDKCTPLGASVARGGATNPPAAVYALTKYVTG